MRIRWTTPAADDLESIHEYLRKHEPKLAHSTVAGIHKAIRSLRKFPNRGRKGREEGTRELLLERLPQIVAYCVKEDAVEILHIWHPAQDR
jgi:toxin ParE1/3/4